MRYLVVFSITPVQAFIGRARKLRDFYVSSKILSYLASAGFNAVNGKKVYPSAQSKSIPNKFVFSIEADKEEQVKSELERIEQSIQNAWLELADITNVPRCRVNDYWNYSWAAVPYKDEKEYKQAHSKVQKLLAAIKLKPRKIRKSQTGKKCPLCGENSVWREDFGANKDEKLCGVCAIKRLLPEKITKNHQLYSIFSDKYPSVTEIAMHRYIGKYGLINEYEIESLQEETKYNELKNKYGKSPSNKEKYYALLAMDGDKMGDLVNKKTTPDEHLGLSQKLDSFNGEVEKIDCFDKRKGNAKLIYTGGDDIFAVLPLENAISIAKEIRELYMKKVVKDEPTTTISAAIVIAHHKEPLREVIQDTHRVLDKIAKEKAGRDALAIRLKKRSGGDRDLFFQWKATNPFKPDETLFDSLLKIKEALSESALTSSLIYRLAQLKDAIGVQGIKSEQILKLFEYEVAHSIGEENVKENAKRLAGLCLAQAFNQQGELKEFNPEAVAIAHFLANDNDDKKMEDK
ncbi:MAG: type III-B CRISPR-associated protein Cas10/Cmr2 [Campylobacteraceae bacterium]|jgi:CRISPR-associated protein Cmr2|nr:type III-B CRISPR-associated protein Cas10/Cmr2 [Campylobacteraceae bacterium]